MNSISFHKLLKNVISKAENDGIISEDEKQLIETIEIEIESAESQINRIMETHEEKVLLQKLLTSVNRVLLKNIVSTARVDGKISRDEEQILELLFKELGFDLNSFDKRPWYVFKVCININDKTNIDGILDHFDSVFCLRGLDPTKVYSGLCLGTKHYVIDEVDVTLLCFAVTPDSTSEWVTKGAFAILDAETNDDVPGILDTTATRLIDENYFAMTKTN